MLCTDTPWTVQSLWAAQCCVMQTCHLQLSSDWRLYLIKTHCCAEWNNVVDQQTVQELLTKRPSTRHLVHFLLFCRQHAEKQETKSKQGDLCWAFSVQSTSRSTTKQSQIPRTQSMWFGSHKTQTKHSTCRSVQCLVWSQQSLKPHCVVLWSYWRHQTTVKHCVDKAENISVCNLSLIHIWRCRRRG